MSVLPITLISLLCGLVAAGAVWWLVSLFENVAHTMRVKRESTAESSGKDNKAEEKEATK